MAWTAYAQPYLASDEALTRAIERHYPPGATIPPGSMLSPLVAGRTRRKTRTSLSVVPEFMSVEARLQEREKEIAALQKRVDQMDQLRARDRELLRQLCLLLIEKNVATRDEILRRMNKAQEKA